MSLHGNDVCLLEVEDYNLYEEEASDHAFARSEKHSSSGGKTMEAEKRIRREIANSNERRRMQSINAGFNSLRSLLPRHEGEKLSKAAILQHTAEYIYTLEQEKTRLLSQNCQLKRLLNQHEGGEIPLKKRKSEILSTIIPDSTDDAILSTRSPEPVTVMSVTNTLQKKDSESDLRLQLDRERHVRLLLEERLNSFEAQSVLNEPSQEVQHTTSHYETNDTVDCKLETDESKVSVADCAVAPLLEAAIKAEPRVEVEILPDVVHEPPARIHLNSMHLPSTSRQNLETIVEAIRHLEGDHLFREEVGDAPLALTKKVERASRPGVIVVKQS